MKRNDFLKTLGLGTAGVLVGESLLSGCMNHDMAAMDMVTAPTVVEGAFTTVLPIPETITSGTALNARSQSAAILAGKTEQVLGYKNGILGPTFRVQRGSTVTIPFTNGLSEVTNIHWHGLLVPASMDGHPDQMVMAGQSFNYTFKIDQTASTAWYHPHPHEKTGKQVFMGLAGMFIVESPEEKALNLPSGNYELPLVIQDKRLDTNGAIMYSPTLEEVMIGYMGETITVNGANAPVQNVTTRTYRLRIVNGSNGRIYSLALSNGNSFMVIGSDGGLLAAPETVMSLLLAPGERADLLVDFSKVALNSDVFLQSNSFSGVSSQGSQSFKIMKFTVNKAETDTFKIPTLLNSLTSISAASAIKTRTFDIGVMMDMGSGGHGGSMAMKGMHTINGKVFNSNRIDESVTLNSTEIWEFDNTKGDEPHPMHLHGTFFQVISRTGGRGNILPHEKGLKDTVLAMPGEKVRIIVKFEHTGKFVFHCHNLEHEDDGMMLNFEVK
ncbi:FtsP/CotA-like multicopper oxidase with cupredoxin domain [Runella defluvii]|uniref:FtsP/CotA-like multicopper oxidase with cupredoxin domain n=1 Tax=Runella defluvii TaxID=370973 RepID=A0A7W5ZQS4_9BACT|nr:multicopper oxidase domain-containing protein [Runella defluvii]MBB3841942.1 FtsP/CotA-like multicopper oxidase with cupredoxin domain [Runella defluvii]